MHKSIFYPLCGDMIELVFHDLPEVAILPIADEVYKEAIRLQKIFNFFDKSSELSCLNYAKPIDAPKDFPLNSAISPLCPPISHPVRSLVCSPELIYVLSSALEMSALTNGVYDPSLGKLFLARKQSKPLPKLNCSYKDIQIQNNTVTLTNPDVLIDLGSIAKGFIADELAKKMSDLGVLSGAVDARGDIRLFGDHEESIEIQHPRDPDSIITSLQLKEQAVATSGDYKQFVGSYETSHIINQKNFISVTVIADNAMTADLLATALFVLPKGSHHIIAVNFPSASAILVDKQLHLYYLNPQNLRSHLNNFEVQR